MWVTYKIDLDEEYDVDMLNNFLKGEIESDDDDRIHINDFDCNYSFKEQKIIEW